MYIILYKSIMVTLKGLPHGQPLHNLLHEVLGFSMFIFLLCFSFRYLVGIFPGHIIQHTSIEDHVLCPGKHTLNGSHAMQYNFSTEVSILACCST